MRFDWLEGFLAFAETRNFTHAAERLHLSQPALFAQVKRLGQDLGVALYRREGRGLELTEEGRQLEAFARELLERARAFEVELHSEVDRTPPVLAAGRGTHVDLLAPALRAWVKRDRPLRLRSGDKEAILEDVRSGRAHLGVAPLDGSERGILTRRLRRVGQVAVVPRGHELAGRARVSLATLARFPLVLPPADRPHRRAVARALREVGAGEPQVALEAEGWDLLMLYASLGLGVAIVNDTCKPPREATAVPVTGLPPLEFYLCAREGGRLPPFAAELRDHLLEART